MMWTMSVGGSDLTSTTNSAERNQFPDSAQHGQLGYIAASNTPGTAPLWRLWNRGSDHLDSSITNEGGYALDYGLGNIFNSRDSGMAALWRLYNPATGDHATVYEGQSIAGYQFDGAFSGYIYPRYGTATSLPVSISGGGQTITADLLAGGSVTSWKWNGIEFDDGHTGFGRAIQTAIFNSGSPYGINPTEAGDEFPLACDGSVVPGWKPIDLHASPIALSSNNGTTLSTRTVPIEWSWCAAPFHASRDQLVAYTGTLVGRDVTPNEFGDGTPSTKFSTFLYLPTAVSQFAVELPAMYLLPAYQHFVTYDAGLHLEQPMGTRPPCVEDEGKGGADWQPQSGHGGPIIATPDNTLAMGIYATMQTSGGEVSYFRQHDMASGNCYLKTAKQSAILGPEDLPAGWQAYTVHVINGSLKQVEAIMDRLYAANK